mgnify:CR=1 FL=1
MTRKSDSRTHKEVLHDKFWLAQFITGILMIPALIAAVIMGGFWSFGVVIVMLIGVLLLRCVKCPHCQKCFAIPSGRGGFHKVKHCSSCGFDLEQVIEETALILKE